MLAPILHAGGFSWDEAVVLVVAIVAVPALSWFTGRFGKRVEGRVSRRDGEGAAPQDDRRAAREAARRARQERTRRTDDSDVT